MRISFLVLTGLAAVLATGASAAPAYPGGAKALEAQLLAAETPDARAFIKDEAQREATLRFVDDETPRNAARKYGATGSEVSKLAFLVLMEAARSADTNVSTLVSGVQADAASRQDIREAQGASSTIAGSQQSQLSTSERTAEQAQGQAFLPLVSSNGDNPIATAKQGTPTPPPGMNLQDAMDRENQIDDLLQQAMNQVTHPA